MKLRLVVEFDPVTQRWSAFFSELPGCASAGDTKNDAVRNAKEALALWLETTSSSDQVENIELTDEKSGSRDDSTYLVSTAANRAALEQSLREASEGRIIDVDL